MSFDRVIDILVDKLESWFYGSIAILPNLLVAVLIVTIFYIIARYATRLIGNILKRASQNKEIINLLTGIAGVAIFTTGVFISLGILKLDRAVLSLLAGVGIIGLALGFAFQDIAANFISGFIMAIRHPFKVGDLVEVSDCFGRVNRIGLRTTKIIKLSGQLVAIPNKKVIENAIVNFSELGERRVEVPVGVSYGDDLEKAKRVAVEAVAALPGRQEEKPVELYYTGFGSSSIDFKLRFWIPETEQVAYLKAQSAAVMAIKQAFDESGVTIPFPIRTLDFAEVGGKQLDEMWPAAWGGPGRGPGRPAAVSSPKGPSAAPAPTSANAG